MKRLKYLLVAMMLVIGCSFYACQQQQENTVPQEGDPQVTQGDPTGDEDNDDDGDDDD